MKVKEYVCEPYCNIFPFDEFNLIQGRCLPLCLGTDTNVLITCKCGSGERHCLLLPIIKTARDSPTGKRIFYVIKSVKSGTGMIAELMGNCQRANLEVQRFKEAEDLDLFTKTTIWILSLDQLAKLVFDNLSNSAFFESISLVTFDNIASAFRNPSAEILFAILRSRNHNIRVAGISYSAEMTPFLTDFLKIPPEMAFLDFTEWGTQVNAEIISCGDHKSDELTAAIHNETSKIIEASIKNNEQICVLFDAKSTAVARQKQIEDLFKDLASPELVQEAAAISDRQLKLSVNTGVALIAGNFSEADENILRKIIASKKLRIIVGLIGFTEKFLDGVNFDKIIIANRTIHPQYCAEFLEMGTKTVFVCSDQSKEYVESSMQAQDVYDGDFEQHIHQYLLQLLRTNCCSMTSLIDEFNKTMFHRVTGVMCNTQVVELEQAGMIRIGEGITTLGQICHDTHVPYQDVVFFNQSEAPRSLKDSFVLICSASAMNNVEVKEEQLSLLKQMKEDPEIMFPSIISDTISEADKVSILVQFMMGVGSIDDIELQREGLSLMSIMGNLSVCLVRVMDHRKEFTGMKWSRIMAKCALWKMWPSDTKRITSQLPGVGATYSAAFSKNNILSIEDALSMSPDTAKCILSRRIDAVIKGWSVIPRYEAGLSVDGNVCQVHVANKRGWNSSGNKIGVEHRYDVILGVPMTNRLLMFESVELDGENKFMNFEVELPNDVRNQDIQLSCIDNVYIGLDIDILSKVTQQFLDLLNDTDDEDPDAYIPQ